MKFVIDANILFAALIKSGYTRHILMSSNLQFFVPEKFPQEFNKHISMLIKKSKISEEQLMALLKDINQIAQITLMPISTYKMQLNFAEKLYSDKDDAPYIALALTLECPIWSNDKILKRQEFIKIYSTKELMELLY